jgi:hypothetical protein
MDCIELEEAVNGIFNTYDSNGDRAINPEDVSLNTISLD